MRQANKDSLSGGILATVIIAPVVILCCGGGLGMGISLIAGSLRALSGFGVVASSLVAFCVGAVFVANRKYRLVNNKSVRLVNNEAS